MTRILLLAVLFAFVKSGNSYDFECGAPSPLQSGIIDPSKRWPNNIVHYEFDLLFPGIQRTLFYKAIFHIMVRTCMRFEHRINGSNVSDYLYITGAGDLCSSDVGRQGGLQNVTLPPVCTNLRTYLHELVHIIGFYHEQSRTDRDQFVNINWENIIPNKTSQFDEKSAKISTTFGVPYDYKSVVHYERGAGSIDGKDTITPLDPDVTIGLDDALSDYDIKEINNMNCNRTQGMRFQNEADGMYLKVLNDSAVPRVIITANWTGGDDQKWTLDWFTLQNRTEGSTLMTWLVDTFTLDVLSANLTTDEVGVWKYHEPPGINQVWYADRNTVYAKYATWQLINLNNTKCLLSMGTSQAKMATCNASDPKQLWKIYNV